MVTLVNICICYCCLVGAVFAHEPSRSHRSLQACTVAGNEDPVICKVDNGTCAAKDMQYCNLDCVDDSACRLSTIFDSTVRCRDFNSCSETTQRRSTVTCSGQSSCRGSRFFTSAVACQESWSTCYNSIFSTCSCCIESANCPDGVPLCTAITLDSFCSTLHLGQTCKDWGNPICATVEVPSAPPLHPAATCTLQQDAVACGDGFSICSDTAISKCSLDCYDSTCTNSDIGDSTVFCTTSRACSGSTMTRSTVTCGEGTGSCSSTFIASHVNCRSSSLACWTSVFEGDCNCCDGPGCPSDVSACTANLCAKVSTNNATCAELGNPYCRLRQISPTGGAFMDTLTTMPSIMPTWTSNAPSTMNKGPSSSPTSITDQPSIMTLSPSVTATTETPSTIQKSILPSWVVIPTLVPSSSPTLITDQPSIITLSPSITAPTENPSVIQKSIIPSWVAIPTLVPSSSPTLFTDQPSNATPSPSISDNVFLVSGISKTEQWCITATNGVDDYVALGFQLCDMLNAPTSQQWRLDKDTGKIHSAMDDDQCLFSNLLNDLVGRVRMAPCAMGIVFAFDLQSSDGSSALSVTNNGFFNNMCVTNRGVNPNPTDPVLLLPCQADEGRFTFTFEPVVGEPSMVAADTGNANSPNNDIEFFQLQTDGACMVVVNAADVLLGQCDQADQTGWKMDGGMIRTKDDNTCLQAGRRNSGGVRGTKLWVLPCDSTNALQKFDLLGDGTLRVRGSALCVDHRGQNANVGSDPIILRPCDIAGHWSTKVYSSMVVADTNSPDNDIEFFQLQTDGACMVVVNAADVLLGQCDQADQTGWKIDGGMIRTKDDDTCLQAGRGNSGGVRGTKLWVLPCDSTNALQKFDLLGDGTLRVQGSVLCVDHRGENANVGSDPIILRPCDIAGQWSTKVYENTY